MKSTGNKVVDILGTFRRSFPHAFVFPIVLFIHFFIISIARPFHLVSEIGWLDPWTSVGYGQVFPETPYPWHYYKESRFFSILYQWFLTHLSSEIYLTIQVLMVSLCSSLVFLYLRKFTKKYVIPFVSSSVVGLSSLLWGDRAGGADYYNMLGNVLLILALICIHNFQGLALSLSRLRLNSMLLGFLSYIVLVEVPSGIIVVFALQVSLLLLLWSNSTKRFQIFINRVKLILLFQTIGVAAVLFAQSVFLLSFGMSPIRLLSGPKFLFDSIVDPSGLKTWWRNIELIEFVKTDYLIAFLGLGILNGISILVYITLLKRGSITSEQRRLFVFQLWNLIAYCITWLLLVFLQFRGSSLALSVHYFATPFLFIGLVFFLTFLVLMTRTFPRFLMFPSWPISYVLILTILVPLISPVYPSIVRTENFKECENSRIFFRESALDLAISIDKKFGPRGTLLTAAEDDVFERQIASRCSSITGRPITDIIMSFSQLGFQGVSSLGPIKNEASTTEYSRFYLAEPFNRKLMPDRCILVWNLVENNSNLENLSIYFEGSTLEIREICPKE
jgi:hypothetical protein